MLEGLVWHDTNKFQRGKVKYSLNYMFHASKNEAKYKASHCEARVSKKQNAKPKTTHTLRLAVDHQPCQRRLHGERAKHDCLLGKKNSKVDALSWFEILQIPREQNSEADVLNHLGTGIDEEELGTFRLSHTRGRGN